MLRLRFWCESGDGLLFCRERVGMGWGCGAVSCPAVGCLAVWCPVMGVWGFFIHIGGLVCGFVG